MNSITARCRERSPNRMSLERHSCLIEPTHLSAKAFKFELRGGSLRHRIAVSGVPEGKERFKELMRRIRKAVGTNDKSALPRRALPIQRTSNRNTLQLSDRHAFGDASRPRDDTGAAGRTRLAGSSRACQNRAVEIYAGSGAQLRQKRATGPAMKCPSAVRARPGRGRSRPQQGGLLVLLSRPAAPMEPGRDRGKTAGGERKGERVRRARRHRLCQCDGSPMQPSGWSAINNAAAPDGQRTGAFTSLPETPLFQQAPHKSSLAH